MSKIFKALFLNLIIPIAGYFLIAMVMKDYIGDYDYSFSEVAEICSGDNNPECSYFNKLYYTHKASLYSGVASVGLIVLFVLSSIFVSNSRTKIASVFPKLIPLTIFITGLQVIVQGVIFTYGLYVLESYYIGRVHIFLIGGAGLAALFAALKMIGSLSEVNKPIKMKIIGKALDKDNQLWKLITSIAEKIGAKVPDNVVLGLEPGFYITGASIALINENKVLTGESLYLSLPLVRLYNKEELSSIIGHELAHFKGEDTKYSLKFAPVYKGLSQAIVGAYQNDSVLSLPGLAFLEAMLGVFSTSVSKISRDREMIADQQGILAGSKEGLAYSLTKFVIFNRNWEKIIDDSIQQLNQGKFIRNISTAFVNNSRFEFSEKSIQETLNEIGQDTTPHPTDSHPPMAVRLKQADLNIKDLSLDKLNHQGDSYKLITNIEEYEEDLTYQEHAKLVALGLVRVPEEKANEDESSQHKRFMLNALYNIASAMILADGKVEQEEIQVAETIGKKLIPDFNSTEFRSMFKEKLKANYFEKIVEYFSFMGEEGKKMIYQYLEAIAFADNELVEEEKKLLEFVKAEWKI